MTTITAPELPKNYSFFVYPRKTYLVVVLQRRGWLPFWAYVDCCLCREVDAKSVESAMKTLIRDNLNTVDTTYCGTYPPKKVIE